ncbi:transposase [Nocardia sp. CWNU-33]|uniref:transposase n=1 Tax=Nocardia sp. CWNU-33 TaxID=3392117 RepID=UPI00398F0475
MYSPRFRERAVALSVDEGRRVAVVAGDLGVTEATLRRWRRQALVDRGEVRVVPTVESVRLRRAAPDRQLEEELGTTRLVARSSTAPGSAHG